MNIQLSDYQSFDVRDIVFSKPEIGSISANSSGPKISFKRLRIGARYRDGSQGDLLLRTPENLLSFGLQENTDLGTGAVSGYQFPICLWNRNGATPDEKAFTDKFNEIVEYVKSYLVAHRDDIEKYDLELTDLKKFNPLYWKMEKGKVVEGRGPMLYVKVMSSKKTGQILTGMIDDDTNAYIDPMDLMNKRCYITGALKIESVFIGNKISLQLKLYEAVVKVIDNQNSVRGLLRPDARPLEKREVAPEDEGIGVGGREASGLPTPSFFEEGGDPHAGEEEVEEYVEEIYEESVVDPSDGSGTTVAVVEAPTELSTTVPPIAATATTAPVKTRRNGAGSRSKTVTA